MGHRPWYVSGTNVSSTVCLECQQAFEPIFVEYGVDLIMQGHVHAYQRNKPMANCGCGRLHSTSIQSPFPFPLLRSHLGPSPFESPLRFRPLSPTLLSSALFSSTLLSSTLLSSPLLCLSSTLLSSTLLYPPLLYPPLPSSTLLYRPLRYPPLLSSPLLYSSLLYPSLLSSHLPSSPLPSSTLLYPPLTSSTVPSSIVPSFPSLSSALLPLDSFPSHPPLSLTHTDYVDPNGLNNPSSPLTILNGAGGHYDGLDTLLNATQWSAYQNDQLYGWSRITFHNRTHMTHQFIASGNSTVIDEVTLYKEHK
jgi:hypothetical protein